MMLTLLTNIYLFIYYVSMGERTDQSYTQKKIDESASWMDKISKGSYIWLGSLRIDLGSDFLWVT